MKKSVIVIAGPSGSGKDSIIRGLIERSPNVEFAVNATTRPRRPNEKQGVDYHFLSEEDFKKRVVTGDIPEHYFREETKTYYGTDKTDIDARLARGKIVVSQVQIVGARYLKEQYGATTFFILPPPFEELERRIRERAPMSDLEWKERLKHTKREIEEDAPFYDYRISNNEGKIDEAIDRVVDILRKEGYAL